MAGTDLRTAFLAQAASCADLGSPFMARLMGLLAEHWPGDTALARRFRAWEGEVGSSGASLPLRVASALHALVLKGRDPRLTAVYPPNTPDDATLREAVLKALHRHDGLLCRWTETPPQTNELRRSAVLIAAAHALDARLGLPMQLSELGASAGLNLLFDRFALEIGEHRWGPADAAVRLRPDWRGALPPRASPRIAERRGVDLNPLDLADPEDALRLLAYLWPDQPDRIARAQAAMALQAAEVDRGDAVEWLEERLAAPWPGRLHLVYHTIAWQYFPAARQARGREVLEAAGAAATEEAPLAWFGLEADEVPGSAALTLRLWPGDIRWALGRADFHGRWVNWSGVAGEGPLDEGS